MQQRFCIAATLVSVRATTSRTEHSNDTAHVVSSAVVRAVTVGRLRALAPAREL